MLNDRVYVIVALISTVCAYFLLLLAECRLCVSPSWDLRYILAKIIGYNPSMKVKWVSHFEDTFHLALSVSLN